MLSPKDIAIAHESARRGLTGGASAVALLGTLFDQQAQAAAAVLQEGCRRLALLTSRRAGKSWLIAVLLIVTCLRRPGARCLWAAITQKNIRRFGWDILSKLNLSLNLGMRPNQVGLSFTFPNGSVIELDGADHPQDFAQKYVGPPYDAFVVDESGSFSPGLLRFIFQVVARPALVDRRGWMALSGTPRHFTKGLFFDATTGADREWSPFHWDTTQNPHMREQWLEELADLKKANPRVEETVWYRRDYLGQWVTDDSELVYGSYRPYPVPEGNVILSPWEHQLGTEYRAGLDLGHRDDMAIVQLAFHRLVPQGHIVKAFKKAGLRTHEMAQHCREFMAQYRGTAFFTDPAWATTVADLQRYGIPCHAAKKARKQEAIRQFNSDLDLSRLVVHAGECAPLIDELVSLPWKFVKDVQDEEDIERVEHPGFANHCTDAALYGWRGSRDLVGELPAEEVLSEQELIKQRYIRQSEEGTDAYWRR